MFIKGQYNLVNTNDSVLPVCDKPYYTNTRIVQNGVRLKFCGTVQFLFVTGLGYFLEYKNYRTGYAAA